MRFRLKQTVLVMAPAMALSLAGPVLGDGTDAQERSGAAQQPQMNQAVPAEAPRLEEQMQASRLVGMDVVDRRGESVGEIEDLVIDLSDGRIRHVVLSSGGLLDIGDKHYVYTLDQFSKSKEGDRLTLKADAETLRTAPSFDSDGWPGFNEPIWSPGRQANGSGTDLRRVSELLGMDLKSPSGVDVGELKDFAIQFPNGEARAVVSFDPGDNADERLVAVPPAKLGIPNESDQAVVNMTRSELMNAPRVSSSDFSS